MTDPETVTRLGAKDSDLSRATQALKDAAVRMSVARAGWLDAHGMENIGATRIYIDAKATLMDAAEDYADAYLRGTQ